VTTGQGGIPTGMFSTADLLMESRLTAVEDNRAGPPRLGDTDESVVDADLKLRGYDNLYVCDLSVFPTAPAANPSLTLAALAMRLSDHLKRELVPQRPNPPALMPTKAFSPDLAWMPNLVLIAKTTYVWLDQLSKRYGRNIVRLDDIPDEELDRLAHAGISGLWLVGIWRAQPRVVWPGERRPQERDGLLTAA